MPAAPFSGEAWAAAIEAGVQNKAAVAEEEHPGPHAAELEAMVGHAEPAAHEESFVSEAPASEHFVPERLDLVSDEVVSDSRFLNNLFPRPTSSTRKRARAC